MHEWRKNAAEAGTVVVKVGSAVISGTDGLDAGVMADIAAQIAELARRGDSAGRAERGRRVVLVSSGAVAAGRAALKRFGKEAAKPDLAAKQAIAAVGQTLLMSAWSQAFQPYGFPVAQILLTRDDFSHRGRFLNIRNTFANLFDLAIIPVVNENDTVSVSELKFGDNDFLSSLLVNLVEADLFVNLTSAEGVRAENPQTNPNAPWLDEIPDIANFDILKICGEKTSAGSGGMRSKLLAARRVAQLGVGTLILPGRKKNSILEALDSSSSSGEPHGTWVKPAAHSISRRKFWLAYQSDPAGSLEIDAGAAQALFSHGASLLPGGITDVQGSFSKGAIVEIKCGGKILGVGLSNYNSGALRNIMGRRRHEVAAMLGQAHYPEVIHRDNLLLDASI